ncbi:MAG: metallophosphoesterase family protein [Candidatus Lokiarchaeia archaeon]
MKMAFFGDIHGNAYGLQSIIEDLKKEKPDRIYCMGDLFIPFPGTNYIWNTVKNLTIPIVRGNGEDLLIEYFRSKKSNPLRTSIQFRPTQLIAKKLIRNIIMILEKFPLTLTLKNLYDTRILVCHGTPFSNQEFLINLEGNLTSHVINHDSIDMIIAGHVHVPYERERNNVKFITVGSGGKSYSGKPEIYYLILEHEEDRWKIKHKSLPYDYESLINDMIDSNFLIDGAPISWLFFNEILNHENTTYIFFRDYYPKLLPKSDSEWHKACTHYLKKIKRWEEVSAYIP